jgi:hypothetical protein
MATIHHKNLLSNPALISMPLIGLVLTLVVLMTAPGGHAEAAPLVCPDFYAPPEGYLTGCRFEGDAASPIPPSILQGQPWTAASPDVDAMLSEASRAHWLVQVGSSGLAPEKQEADQGESDAPATESDQKLAAQAKGTPYKDFFSTIKKDERWYYMNIDQDGTYILLGDPAERDEWLTTEDDNDLLTDELLPKGFGIGKRWQF